MSDIDMHDYVEVSPPPTEATLMECTPVEGGVELYARTDDGQAIQRHYPYEDSFFVELTDTFGLVQLETFLESQASLVKGSEIVEGYRPAYMFSPEPRTFAKIVPARGDAKQKLEQVIEVIEPHVALYETVPDIDRAFLAERRIAVGDKVSFLQDTVKPTHKPTVVQPTVLYFEVDHSTIRYILVEDDMITAKRALIRGLDEEVEDLCVDRFASEQELLIAFASAVSTLDPDVLMYFSADASEDDMVDVLKRMRKLEIAEDLSRRSGEQVQFRSQKGCATQLYFHCPGRVILNLADARFDREHGSNVTALATHLGVTYVPEKDGPELMYECNRHLSFSRGLFAKAHVLRSTVNYMLETPPQGHFTLLLTTLFVQNQFLVGMWDSDVQYPEAVTPERVAKPGYYTAPVTVMKFPHFFEYTVIAYNLCMSTIIDSGKHAKWMEDNPDAFQTVHGINFAKCRAGVFPLALSQLLDGKAALDAALKKDTPEKERKHLKAVQRAFREAICGFSALCENAMSNSGLVGTVARHQQSQVMKKIIEDGPGEAVYSDEDSVFFHFEKSSPHDACTLSNHYMNECNKELPDPVEIVTDSLYVQLLVAERDVFFGVNHSDLGKTIVTKGLDAPVIREDKTLEETCKPLFDQVRARYPNAAFET